MNAFLPARRRAAARSRPAFGAPSRAREGILREAVAEALWPTRCAVCDEPGEPLCAPCAQALPVIDWWAACPRCGAPWGRMQCCECNPVTLGASGRTALPLDQMASAVMLDEAARAVVVTYKDRGERRLAGVMAARMASCVPPAWLERAVMTFIPASPAARRRRGFDHAELLAESASQVLGLPCAPLLRRPRASDQRRLTKAGRAANMAGAFTTLPGASAPGPVVVVDDVCTTGATLFAAADALRSAGISPIYALTFARA